MRSLFEKEEREEVLTQIKVDLISRFYPFTKEEVLKYHSILSINRYHFLNDELFQWDYELLDCLDERIEWTAIWKIRNIKLDFEFFKRYEQKINFSSIHISRNIEWSDDLLSEYGDRFDWNKLLITKDHLATIDNLRKYGDRLDWGLISRRISIEFTEAILDEFSDKWDWKKLSANEDLTISVEFIQRHIEKLDFDSLSLNPKSIELIYQYPQSKRWNWQKVILNPAIIYNKESFAFFFSHYKRYYEAKEHKNPFFKKLALPTFIFLVCTYQLNDISYFMQDDFVKFLPWENLCQNNRTILKLEFIEKYKDKLNFKAHQFIINHKDIISTEFIEANPEKFDPTHFSFYYLPLTIQLLDRFDEKIDMNKLSRCRKLDWTWEFIDRYFDRLNLNSLAENEGIYENLIKNKLTHDEVLEILDNELRKQRR